MGGLSDGKSVIIYETEDERTAVAVYFYKGSAWLSPAQMAALFERQESVIMQCIEDIYREKELMPEGTVTKFEAVSMDGGTEASKITDHYNLDVVISVGYRVRSLRGTPFRQWAFGQLNQSMGEAPSAPVNNRYLENLEKNVERNSRSIAATYGYLKKLFTGK